MLKDQWPPDKWLPVSIAPSDADLEVSVMDKRGIHATAATWPFAARAQQIATMRLYSITNVRYWPKADIPSCTAHV